MDGSADNEPAEPEPSPESSSYPQQAPLPHLKLPPPSPAILQFSAHAGPLPPPQQLTAYESAHPGAAAWILNEAEANAQHVRDMERRAIRYQARDDLLHRLLPFVLVVILLIVSSVMAVFASKILGGLTFFATLAGVVTVYLRGSQPRESQEPDPRSTTPRQPVRQ